MQFVNRMIKKITSIKNLGVYQNFAWRDLPEFASKNIIYGWNYSGKTTLSRLFSSIRDKSFHKSFDNVEFKIQLSDNSEITHLNLSTSEFPILVFNSEYIRDNLKWETDENIAGITFDVGENVGIREQIDENLKKLEKINGSETLLSRSQPYEVIVTEFDNYASFKFSAEAKSIKNNVFNSLIDFDKRHLTAIKDQVVSSLEESIVIETEKLNKIKKVALSTNDKDPLDKMIIS